MLNNLINNIAFLIALAAAGQLVVSRFHQFSLKYSLVLGVLFGSVTLLGMANSVNFAPGVFFDGRSIVLAVAGVVGGGLTAAIAAGMDDFIAKPVQPEILFSTLLKWLEPRGD